MRNRRRRVSGLAVGLFLVITCGLLIVRGPARLPGTTAGPAPARTPISSATYDRVPALVLRVIDGDTILVQMNGHSLRLRYIGIDTPESVTPGQPIEPFGREAAAANSELVAGKTVFLEKDMSDTDRNGRLLRYVYVDGTFVNAELVRRGLAEAKTYHPDVKRQGVLDSMEREARAARRGIWSVGN